MSAAPIDQTTITGDLEGSTGIRMTVLGTGYLGATHAVCMALLGHEVLGVDVDARKIESLSNGEVPFYEPGLDESLRKALSTGRLSFTTDFAEAGAFGDVHFLCVGTPQKPGSHAADMRYVDGCIDSLAPHLTAPCLVIGKSTVPVGTAQRLAARLTDAAPAGADVHLAWNPEFLREGYAVEDTLHPDRLVFGVTDPADEARMRSVYEQLLDDGTPLVVADLPTAELVKVAANSFLATKISYINAMAELCEAVDADVTKLQSALSYDTRIGGRFLQPGLGFGGGCLPKDIRAFMARAEELGVGEAVGFLREVDAINLRRRARTVDLIQESAAATSPGGASPSSAPPSSRTATTCATPRRSTWRPAWWPRAPTSGCTTRRPWTTLARCSPTSPTPSRSTRRSPAPTSSPC